jgi:hypothetical protein
MTRELPPLLEPIGRLDLLDSVFQNVSEHYELSPRTDSESLARQADFLTQWAQILRPRGLEQAAIERLQQAMEKARAATDEKNPSPAAIRARVSTGRRLGEALIEGKHFHEGEVILKESLEFSKAHPLGGVAMQIAEAELATEFAFLARDRDDVEGSLELAEAALRQWEPLLPGFMQAPISPAHQQLLLNITSLHALRAFTQKDPAKQIEAMRASKELTESLVKLAPENAIFQHELAITNQNLANLSAGNPAEKLALLLSADALMVVLVKNDPTNAKLLTDAVSCAHALAFFSEEQHDQPELLRWRAQMSDRLDQLCEIPSTNPKYLIARAEFSRICAHLHMQDDWPKARHHLESMLKVKKRINELDPSQKDLAHFENRVFERIKEFEGPPAAEAWRQSYEKKKTK